MIFVCMTLIGVKSKYGSCNGNCTGYIIIIYLVENFSTKSLVVIFFGSIPKKDNIDNFIPLFLIDCIIYFCIENTNLNTYH